MINPTGVDNAPFPFPLPLTVYKSPLAFGHLKLSALLFINLVYAPYADVLPLLSPQNPVSFFNLSSKSSNPLLVYQLSIIPFIVLEVVPYVYPTNYALLCEVLNALVCICVPVPVV